jgi:hypothetical protein
VFSERSERAREVQLVLHLNVAVGERSPVLELPARKDEALLVGGDASTTPEPTCWSGGMPARRLCCFCF